MCVCVPSLVYLWTQRMVCGSKFSSFHYLESGIPKDWIHIIRLSDKHLYPQNHLVSLLCCTQGDIICSRSAKQSKLTQNLCILRGLWVALNQLVLVQQWLPCSEHTQKIQWYIYLERGAQVPHVSVLRYVFLGSRKTWQPREKEFPQYELISTHH